MKTINLDRSLDIKRFWDVIGFVNGTLITVMGSTGAGKTTVSIILACLAYAQNRKILFIGNEDYHDQFDKYSLRYGSKKTKKPREEEDWIAIRVINNDINFEEINEYVREYSPNIIVIDSYAVHKGFDDMMDFSMKIKSLASVSEKIVIVATESNVTSDDLAGNVHSFVSDIILFCSLQDKSIRIEVIKSRSGIKKIFESEY